VEVVCCACPAIVAAMIAAAAIIDADAPRPIEFVMAGGYLG
jgi:hypothetical protein